MEAFTLFILPAFAGVVIGILSGLLGIGGGTVMVPVFRLLFNMSPVMSTATSLFAIVPTSISGAVTHVRHKTCIPVLGVATGLGGALTSPLGVWLAQISPAWLIMVAAAIVVGGSAITMLTKAFEVQKASTSGTRLAKKKVGATASFGDEAQKPGTAEDSVNLAGVNAPVSATTTASETSQRMTRKQLVIGVIIGLITGVMAGYVGVGGGFIMVPLMLSLLGIAMRYASGTSLIAMVILAIPGVVEQGMLGNINYLAGVAVVVGSIPGAVVGARLVRKVPERALRLIFGGFLLAVAALLVLNEFGILG